MIVLTDAGASLVERATTALNEVFADIGLTEDDTTQLVGVLARFRRDAGDFAEPAPIPEPL
jgi:hypothetical protein